MKVLKSILSFFKNTWLTQRFFLAIGVIILLFALSFTFELIFHFAQASLIFLAIVVLLDLVLLYRSREVFKCERQSQKLLSNGDENTIKLFIENIGNYTFQVAVYDELPAQLQERNFHFDFSLKSEEKKEIKYTVTPKERGLYAFGNVNIFFTNLIGFVKRRQIIPLAKDIPVYPSIIQMKKFELKALEKASHYYGIKKLRRLGQSYEFEQILNYVK